MCEFKIIRKNDEKQVAEEILVLNYSENNELLMKDVLGMGGKLDSALILDVNTLSQKCVVLEHPLIKDFIGLMKNIVGNTATREQIESFLLSLESIKNTL